MSDKKTAPKELGTAKRQGIRQVQLVEIIQVQACVGKGTEADPKRIITEYWSKNGRLLAVNDPTLNSCGHQLSLD